MWGNDIQKMGRDFSADAFYIYRYRLQYFRYQAKVLLLLLFITLFLLLLLESELVNEVYFCFSGAMNKLGSQ